jgi:hypothetical protein
LLRATIPPNAARGSPSYARRKAVGRSAPVAKPQVDIAQLLAVELFRKRDRCFVGLAADEQRGALVRVLAIAEVQRLVQVQHHPGAVDPAGGGEVVGDDRVVLGAVREGALRLLEPVLPARAALVLAEVADHLLVALG